MHTLKQPPKIVDPLFCLTLSILLSPFAANAQSAASAPAGHEFDTAKVTQRVDQLTRALDAAQAHIVAEQQEIDDLRRQIVALRALPPDNAQTAAVPAAPLQPTPDEQAQLVQSQVATLDQEKVESLSKFPVRVHGTLLINGFVNTRAVNDPVAPSNAAYGSGDTGLSLRQTVLGLDALGPHVFRATTHGDLEVDFFGSSGVSGYNDAGGLLRLRTAHAALDWNRTEVFFEYERPLISPYTPQSLLAVAVPELAWSGNLWAWNPQVGISHTWGNSGRFHARTEAALIDPANPVYTDAAAGTSVPVGVAPSAAELSRRPGAEARVSVLSTDEANGFSAGAGGYFSPHSFTLAGLGNGSFDAWAGTLDLRAPLGHGLSLTATAYRGQGLGGLGGGGYHDYVYNGNAVGFTYRALNDAGGWTQLHQTLNQKISWNLGFGIDNPFAGELRNYAGGSVDGSYANISRNRTIFTNVLFSPRAYLIFSAEYRNFRTAPVQGPLWTSNVTGLGAAYRF